LPVIVREEKEIAGKRSTVKVYKTDRIPMSKEDRLRAEKLDTFLSHNVKDLAGEMRKKGLLDLKGRRGVLKLWYEVGRRLVFVDDPKIVDPEDRPYVWQAIYDHALEYGLAPGSYGEREQQRPHFKYCYELAKKFPDFDFVNGAGDWSAWVEFLDSPSINSDSRIVEWLSSKRLTSEGAMRDWLRRLTREIRREFPYKGQKTDTSVFGEAELREKLDSIFVHVFGDNENPRRTVNVIKP
jgi:hypothetical protein